MNVMEIRQSSGRAWAERTVIIAAAGRIGERRARQEGEGGWCRCRWPTRTESVSIHEAAHAVVAAHFGQQVYELSMAPNELKAKSSSRSVQSHRSLAFCYYGVAPFMAMSAEVAGGIRSDRTVIAELGLALGDFNWRGGLRCIRSLKARTTELVEQNWELISGLAAELRCSGQLDQAQIAVILERGF